VFTDSSRSDLALWLLPTLLAVTARLLPAGRSRPVRAQPPQRVVAVLRDRTAWPSPCPSPAVTSSVLVGLGLVGALFGSEHATSAWSLLP
jgi:hypothetical protein